MACLILKPLGFIPIHLCCIMLLCSQISAMTLVSYEMLCNEKNICLHNIILVFSKHSPPKHLLLGTSQFAHSALLSHEQQCCSIDAGWEDFYYGPQCSLSATDLVSIWVSWPSNSLVVDLQLQHGLPPSVLKMSQQSSHKCRHVLQVVCPTCYFFLAPLISLTSGIQRGKTHHGSG